uniref:Putative Radical SAM superfamily protein n=1 Tax=uncultured marine microorganism HF4000_007I05 TaxID=455511 RepID=B3T0X5_9ZZZZ|nr:putative Radical SAM superfamily protein [uncultured marine microorganism HF4000_007I05]
MSDVDALLITPPSRIEVYQGLSDDYAAIEPPVWSMLIANYLIQRGYNAQILDAEAENLTHDQTAEKILKINPKLAVFMVYGQQPSASTQCMPGGKRTCDKLNELSSNSIKTIVVGTHASALPKKTLEEEPYNFVCQGEGPITITKLIENIKNGKFKLEEIPGLWFYDKDKEIKFNQRAPMFLNLDLSLPGQAWKLLDMKKYKAHNWHTFGKLETRNRYASLQTSLGCPFKCTFCCINAPFEKNTIRFWTPKHIINQIKIIVEDYNIFNIKIPDEMFVLNPKQVSEICDEIINSGYGSKLNFWAYARIDTLEDNEMLKKMIKSGFKWLALGIESSSKHVRDGVVKGRFNNYDIEDIVKKVRDMGFFVGANYIFGLPDDNNDSMKETLDLSLRINSEWANFYSGMAYPGSQLYPMAKKKGWTLPDDKVGPGWIGYSQHAYESLPLRTEHVKGSEVLEFRDKAFDIYFKSSDYLSMITKTFGKETTDHITKMASHKLKRKHNFEKVNY